MLKYAVKRILLAILTIFIIAAITFFAMNAIPGGPFAKEKAPEARIQAVLEARFNLDKPVGEQFILYLRNLLKGTLAFHSKPAVKSPKPSLSPLAYRPGWAGWR